MLPAALAATLLLLAGCGDDAPGAKEENTALRNGNSVEASTESGDATDLALGEFAELGDHLRVRVGDTKVGGDDGGPWLEIAVRAENDGSEDQMLPEIGIVCSGNAEQGSYQADSTLLLTDTVPAGSFKEGTLNLLLPGDSRTGEKIAPCETPVFIRATPGIYVGDEPPSFRWELPETTVTELNAAAAHP